MRLVDKAIELAKAKRINQAELARMIGAAPARLSEWKRDEGKPSVDQALRMARAVGTTLDYLADDSQDEPPKSEALSVDEQAILAVYRDLRDESKINQVKAIRGLMFAASAAVKEINGEVYYSAELHRVATQDLTESRLNRERERKRPKKAGSKPDKDGGATGEDVGTEGTGNRPRRV